MRIIVYGTDTSGHQYVVHSLKSVLDRAAIDYSLVEEADVNVFLERGIESVPAVQVDDEPIINIRNNSSFGVTLRKILHKTLEKNNFGALPRFLIPFSFDTDYMNSLVYGHRLATELNAVVQVSTVCNGSFDLEVMDSCSHRLEDISNQIERDGGGDILKSALVTSSILYGEEHEAILNEIELIKPQYVILPLENYSFLDEDDSDSLVQKIRNKYNIPVLLVPNKANYKRIENIFCFCQDESCFESQKDYFLKFSSLYDSTFSVFVGCPKNNGNADNINVKDIFLSSNINLIEKNEIQSFEGFQKQLSENEIDFIFISDNHCALKHYYRNSNGEFSEAMKDKPILFL